MNRNLKTAVVFIAALGALGAVLYFAEWKEIEIPGPPSEEAQRNPFLAAERFLATYGASLRTESGLSLLDDLPPVTDVIVVGSSLRSVSQRRQDALFGWVESGGRLLVLAREFSADRETVSGDPVLRLVEVMLREGQLKDEDETNGQAQEQTDAERLEAVLQRLELDGNRCGEDHRLTSIQLEGEAITHRVAFSGDRYLDFASGQHFAVAANALGGQLLARRYGSGLIYVVTSLSFLRNGDIGCHDHAHFLRWMAEDRDTVWLVFDTEMPSVLKIIWDKFTLAVLLGGLLLVLWLWRGRQNNAAVGVVADSRRSVLEHVTGMARFHWQQGEQQLLIEDIRRSTLRGVHLRDDQQRREWLSSIAAAIDLDPQQVRWALFEDIPRDAQAIKRMVRILIKVNQSK